MTRIGPYLYGKDKAQKQPWIPVLLCLSLLCMMLSGLLLYSESIRRELRDTLTSQDHAIDVLQEELRKRDRVLDDATEIILGLDRKLRTIQAGCQPERPL